TDPLPEFDLTHCTIQIDCMSTHLFLFVEIRPMPHARRLLIPLRLLAAVQIVVGIGFWTNHWLGLRGLHLGVGTLFVLTLWVIAALAIAAKRATGLAIVAIVWGVAIAGVGAAQQGLLIGDSHWIVRVLHLAMAVAAMPMAERLARPSA